MGTEVASHQLLLRAGLVNMLTSGVYSYLPLGLKVLNRIEKIIREEMLAVGAQELFLPCLQPMELWKKTGRDQVLVDVMIRFKDKRGREMCLGPTHEEVITELVKNYVQSYRQLPLVLYQIQTKFRDEVRTRFGIVRACEFIMKDAYSFDRDMDGLKENYQLMYEAYKKIFQRCELETVIVQADSGAMGGEVSHEFLVPAMVGEDAILKCDQCDMAFLATPTTQDDLLCSRCGKGTLKKIVAMELGHIFQLGTKYSQDQQALFLDEDGKQKHIIMGCYGIGVSRLIAAIIETHHDSLGIVWPKEVAPFAVEILPLKTEEDQIMSLAHYYYHELKKSGLDVLLDDRPESPGKKFNDADLIGIPYRIIIGKKTLTDGTVEIKNRKTQQVIMVNKDQVIDKLFSLWNGKEF